MSDQQRIRLSLSLSAFLGAVVFFLVYLVARKLFEQDINNLFLLIAGMLTAAALSMLAGLFEAQGFGNVQTVHFDEDRTRKVVDDIIDADYSEISIKNDEFRRQSEIDDATLLSQDPTLALAKLRIDLERELRRIAYVRGIIVDKRKISISRLMENLSKDNIISRDIISVISSILPVCNAAIHGGDVKLDVAINVLEIGRDVIGVLRTYPRETVQFNK